LKPAPAEQDLVLKLLQENSTLGEVCQYLKQKGLPSSAGSWDELREKRLQKRLDDGTLSREHLIDLLRLAEEHGKQHVFLYRCAAKEAAPLTKESTLRPIIKDVGLEKVFLAPRILDQPSTPTVTDVRIEEGPAGPSLVIKIVEQRTYRTFVDQKTDGGYFVLRYKDDKIRAVNVVRLTADGQLDLRVFSHKNANDYRNDISSVWSRVNDVIEASLFKQVSLVTAKNNLLEKRSELKGILKFSRSQLRNQSGVVLSAATGSEESSLFEDVGANKSIDEFLHYKAYCDASNVWWLKGDNGGPGVPSRDVHVILSSSVNEFVLTAKCQKKDYEYVLGQLRAHNS
jgi:hypothetical protein